MTSTAPPGPTGPHSLPPLNLAAIRDYFRGINSRLNLLETNRQPIPSRLATLNDSTPMAYAQDGDVPTYQQSSGTYVPKPVGAFGYLVVPSAPAITASGDDVTPFTQATSSVYESWASSICLPYNAGAVLGPIALVFNAPLPATTVLNASGVVANGDASTLLNFDRATTIPAGTTVFEVTGLNAGTVIGGPDLTIGGTSNSQILTGGGLTYAWQVWIALDVT